MAMDNNLPKNWQWVKLGEILDYEQPTQYIVKNTQYSNEYLTPVLTAGKSFILGYTNEDEGVFEAPLPVIIFDDFTTSTKFVNFPFKVKSSAMKILKKSNKADIDIRFVFFMMQKLEINNDTHKRYWLNVVSHIKIPLPPLKIQREIVEILESKLEKIKEAKALLEKSLQECETYRLSLLESAFSGNLTPHSQDWQWVKLEEVIQIIGGGTPNTTIDEYWNGNISWLSIADFNCDEKFVSQTQKSITEKGLKESSTRMLEKGDIIISARGTIGAVAILDKPMAFNQSCYGIKAGKKIDTDYLYWTLKHFSQSLKNDSYGVCLKAITKRNLSELSIPLPPLEIQREIVEILESKLEKIKEAKALIEKSLQECETYRLALLESAFRGELKQ